MTSAMILSGGGAYAAYEVGVMKALFHGECPATGGTPFNPQVFTGTSAGSFNAAIMVSQTGSDSSRNVEHLETVWLNEIADNPQKCGNGVFRFRGNVLTFFAPGCLTPDPTLPFVQLAEDTTHLAQDWLRRVLAFAVSTDSPVRRSLELIDLMAFVSTEPFQRTLQRIISLNDIRASEKTLLIAATDWAVGEVKIFTKLDMTEPSGLKVIMASSAIPGFFPPVEIDGHVYVDGGVLLNTPLSPAIDAGADVLHVTYLDPDVKNIPLARLNSTYDVFERALIVKMADTFDRDVENAKEINQGLALLERARRREPFSDADLRAFIPVISRTSEHLKQNLPYRKLTIHRYHPKTDLGGALGLLDFGQARLASLIELGYQDAVEHDCAESECVLPN